MRVRRSSFFAACVFTAAAVALLAGCGSPPAQRSTEEALAEVALESALDGRNAEFVSLVAPSFLEDARRQMPDADDEVLGKVLISGFLEGVPFEGIVDATYFVEVEGDRAVVHVWGTFRDSGGAETDLPETDAVRIPLINEGGRWYLDLLDL